MGLTPAYRPFTRFFDCKATVAKLWFLGNIGDEDMRWLLILLAVGACARREPPPKVVPIKPVSMTAERFSELDKRCFDMSLELRAGRGGGPAWARGLAAFGNQGRSPKTIHQAINLTAYQNCLANYEIETKVVPPT